MTKNFSPPKICAVDYSAMYWDYFEMAYTVPYTPPPPGLI